jgi:hypothetical protein
MGRKGSGFSLRLLVIILILLIVAGLVIAIFTGRFGILDDILDSESENIKRGLAAETCIQKKNSQCSGGASGDGWADNAEFDGETCSTWIEERGVLGGEVKGCDEEYSE